MNPKDLKNSIKKVSNIHMTGNFPRPPKPQGKGIVKALGQSQTTGRFNAIAKAKGKGVAIAQLQNKLAKRRNQPIPYSRDL